MPVERVEFRDILPMPHAGAEYDMRDNINGVLHGINQPPGFVINGGESLYPMLVGDAGNFGFEVADQDQPDELTHESAWSESLAADSDALLRMSRNELQEHGVTPLHVDIDRGSGKFIVCRVNTGAYLLYMFERGPDAQTVGEYTLNNRLEDGRHTAHVLQGNVDTSMLGKAVHRLEAKKGDLLVFDPSKPHMAVTTNALRAVDRTMMAVA